MVFILHGNCAMMLKRRERNYEIMYYCRQPIDGPPNLRKVIREQWIQDSIEAGKVLNEETYLIRVHQVQDRRCDT